MFILDDDSAIDETNLRRMCALLIEEHVLIPWGITLGAGSIRDDSTYALLRASRCVKVNICVESANPRIVKEYRKPYTGQWGIAIRAFA